MTMNIILFDQRIFWPKNGSSWYTYIWKGKKRKKEKKMDIYKNQRHIMSCLYCKYFFLFYFFSLPTPQHHSIQHPFLCLNNVFFPFSSFFLIHFYYPATHSQGMIYIDIKGVDGMAAGTNWNPEEWKFFSIIQDW